MTTRNLNIGAPIRTALITEPTIGPLLSIWNGEPAVFTRRPLPADASGSPYIMVNPAAAIGDQDFINQQLPIVMRDVAVYGDQPKHYRLVEDIAYAVREFFHRNKWAITPEGYDVIQIYARGPIPGATDSQTTVGRLVGLTVQLRRQK